MRYVAPGLYPVIRGSTPRGRTNIYFATTLVEVGILHTDIVIGSNPIVAMKETFRRSVKRCYDSDDYKTCKCRQIQLKLCTHSRTGICTEFKPLGLRVRLPLGVLVRYTTMPEWRNRQTCLIQNQDVIGSSPISGTMQAYSNGTEGCLRSNWFTTCGFDSHRLYYVNK